MYKLATGRSSLWLILGLALSLIWSVPASSRASAPEPTKAPSAPPVQEKGGPPEPTPPSRSPEIVFTGKFFCSLKRSVPMPFKGTITSVNVKSGQRVEAGEILARYRLAPDATVQIQQRLNPPRLKELESKLAEVEKSMVSLEVKQRELNQLSQQKLAAPMSKTQTDREVQQLAKQKRAVQENLAQEKQLALEDQAFLKSQLGTAAKPGQVPREATIIAPISGFIIWVHPDLREGGELDPMRAVFQVGVMDPMVIRAQVYELEALQLNLGGAAEVTVESLPGRNFEAQLSRISWAPVPPPVWVPAGQEQPSYYEVELTVPNPDLVLKEGLKGRITLRRPR